MKIGIGSKNAVGAKRRLFCIPPTHPFRPPRLASSVRIFSNRHRQLGNEVIGSNHILEGQKKFFLINQRKIFNYSVHNYWKLFIKKPLPAFKDWLEKEDIFLRENIKKGSKVLDIGCGIGKHIKLLAGAAKEINGVDCDGEAVKEARKNLSELKNVKIFFEDAKKMHFKNDVFDFVICMGNSFGDFGENTFAVLNEMKRVIKPSGKIIISVYSGKALNERKKQYKKIGIKIRKVDSDGTVHTEDGLVLQQFSRAKLKKIFEKVGLNVKIIELNPVSYICEAVKI